MRADAGKGLPHHLAGAFLLHETAVEQHFIFARARGFCRWRAGFHPFFRVRRPSARKARQLFMGFAGRGQFLVCFHHRLWIFGLLFLAFLGENRSAGEEKCQACEYR